MPNFDYSALSKNGETLKGTLMSPSFVAAGRELKEQGLIPISISEKKDRNVMEFFQQFSSVPLKEKIAFIQNLGLLLKSGVAAPRALRIIAEQTGNKKFKSMIASMAAGVESGKSLRDAMAEYPKVFSHIFISMIEVGELSGNLEKSLEYLRVQLQREADLKAKTKGAMIYPAVIVSVMIVIGILLAIFVLPKLTATFKEFNTELPIMTKIVVKVVDVLAGNAILVLAGLVAFVGAAIAFFRTSAGGRAFDAFLLYMPFVNPVVKKVNMARFSRILGSLMKSGISVVEGLRITGEAMENSYYKDVVKQTGEAVKVGKPLTESLAKHEKLYPFIVTQMLAIGEETGNLETILDQLAEHYEQEIDETMKNISSIIEPILLIVIGVVVGFLALALIMPIYNIGQNIQ